MPPAVAASASSIFRYYFTALILLVAFLQTPSTASSFLIKAFRKDSIFESNIALLGDAKVVDVNGSSVAQLTELKRFSVGRLAVRRPFKLLEGSPSKLVSFSTYFSFSLSNENGDGLAFLMVSNWSAFEEFDGSSFGISHVLNETRFKALVVEIDTFKDDKEGDLNGNHEGVDVGRLASVKLNNASSSDKLVLNSGEKLSCWIDYEASSKRLDVRLSRFSALRPVKPLLTHSIDFARKWNGSKEFYMGVSSSNGNSTQTCFIYSWGFNQRFAPKWMHSQPMDPSVETVTTIKVPKRSHCVMRVLAALIFGAACGVLGAYMVMLMWRIIANRRPVTPEELVADPSQFKVILVGNKAIKDGQK